jgi:hypothetical protein
MREKMLFLNVMIKIKHCTCTGASNDTGLVKLNVDWSVTVDGWWSAVILVLSAFGTGILTSCCGVEQSLQVNVALVSSFTILEISVIDIKN